MYTHWIFHHPLEFLQDGWSQGQASPFSSPCHKFSSNIHTKSFHCFSLCIHHFIVGFAILSLPFLVLVIQCLCYLYWQESLYHPYHCLINWTNVSCSVCPRFQIMLDALVLDFNVSFSCLNVLQKLASICNLPVLFPSPER